MKTELTMRRQVTIRYSGGNPIKCGYRDLYRYLDVINEIDATYALEDKSKREKLLAKLGYKKYKDTREH